MLTNSTPTSHERERESRTQFTSHYDTNSQQHSGSCEHISSSTHDHLPRVSCSRDAQPLRKNSDPPSWPDKSTTRSTLLCKKFPRISMNRLCTIDGAVNVQISAYRAVEALRVPVLSESLDPPIAWLNRKLAAVALGLKHGRPVYTQYTSTLLNSALQRSD